MVIYHAIENNVAVRISSDQIEEKHKEFSIIKLVSDGIEETEIVLNPSDEIPEGFIEDSQIIYVVGGES